MALFNAPALLGGQASKAGLSCSSCHNNGRDNPHFLLPSLSGKPGTADVTNSFFGATRGNAVFDPVPIPDLAQPGKISRARNNPELQKFTRSLIVEEFSGNEPSAATLKALAAYMRTIGVCDGEQKAIQTRNLKDQLSLLDASLSAAIVKRQRGEIADSNVLISGARHQLGLIHERYAGEKFGPIQKSLLSASRRLQTLMQLDDTDVFIQSVQHWQKAMASELIPALLKNESQSFYNADRLAVSLKQ
jgi:hypothetical protein